MTGEDQGDSERADNDSPSRSLDLARIDAILGPDLDNDTEVPEADLRHVDSPADPNNDSRSLSWEQLVSAWLMSFRSDHTRRAYGNDLIAWTRWCAGMRSDPLECRRVHVDAYVRSIESEMAKASIARRIAALSSLYEYAVDEGVVEFNIARSVKRPKVSEMSNTRWLTSDEMRAFIDCAEQHGARDHLASVLLGLSGLRSGELRTLRLEEVGSFGEHTTILVHGKGERDERVPVPPVTAELLWDLVADRDEGWVFTGGPWRGWGTNNADPGGERLGMSSDQLRRIVTRLANRAGINSTTPKVSPHSFRHAAITLALDAGVSLRQVEKMARHADPRTTRRYDRTRNDFDQHASYALERFLGLGASTNA